MSWRLGFFDVGVIPGVPLATYLPDAPLDALIDPPCFCFIASDGSSIVLIDTGPDGAASAAVGMTITGDTTVLLSAGLRAWGATTDDIDLIIHTHLHYDHMQNDLAFPCARVAVQATELSWATSAAGGPYYLGVADLAEALNDRLILLDGQTELLPGLTALPNGGHTPGHQSVLFQTSARQVCVCGDIVSLQQNLTTIGPVCPDKAATAAFLKQASAAGWLMLPSHDPDLREHPWYLPGQTGG
ncbi:MAG TPA: MBL fold metallo-hydrolase [Streptosporangiaceae bacterium]|nr:MBL fold metallo-hydrolase [Streptosporangiaceae bacterium]